MADETRTREQRVIHTSIIGIATNFVLAGFKAFVGLITHSIAITLDAVNNLSDALSSVVTILGTRYANKAPDRDHPLGHGRAEFVSAQVVSIIVLYAGVSSLVESIKKIIEPETPDYSLPALVVVGVAVVVKIVLGSFFKKVGREVNSDSLYDSGQDATLDSVISATTLAAAIIYLFCGLSLEAWLGAVISIVIIKSGYEMLSDTTSQILGRRVDAELSQQVKQTAAEVEGVLGVYDLILHSYGPDRWQGSLHVEVPDTMSALEIDDLERRVQETVYVKLGVALTGVGIYAVNTADPEVRAMQSDITSYVTSQPYVLQMHGFYVDKERAQIRFDIVVDFDAPSREGVLREISAEVACRYPAYTPIITLDSDISD
jgi:cation diffusion facilitator family transporter